MLPHVNISSEIAHEKKQQLQQNNESMHHRLHEMYTESI